MQVVILIVILIVILTWVLGFIYINDFSISSKKLQQYKRLLVIFPHPDDEVINAGGLIQKLSHLGANITLSILSKGEKGTSDGHIENNLKQIRTEEAKRAAKHLGVSTLIHEDFGDGDLMKHKKELTMYIDDLIKKDNPDLILTYDQSGLYGHEDHIVVSEIVTNLVKTKYSTIDLWYPSLPKRVFSLITLPEHMAKDTEFLKKRAFPSIRIFTGYGLVKKIHAVYEYRSQLQSFKNSFPIKLIPLWFYYSMQLYEYYSEAD